MPKTSTEAGALTRHRLDGACMGTRWSALVFAPPDFDPGRLKAEMQAAVDEVDAQMSTWRPESDLMRMNRAPAETWVRLPGPLIEVLATGLAIGRLSGGAFDVGMGDAVRAWGFGPAAPDPEAIRAARDVPRLPAHEVLELDPDAGRARKRAPLALDLCGIAKGYGADRLAAVARAHGISAALLSLDGELVAYGLQPGRAPWPVAVERPLREVREVHAVLELEDAAVATSGDYRHWVEANGEPLSHTMDPRRGLPLRGGPASVTVIARNCMEADAFATAIMVMGEERGAEFAEAQGLSALILSREGPGPGEPRLRETGVGPIFAPAEPAPRLRAGR